ncbi:hypothetical protein CcrKarma_gp053 [Caulobacter virus Karma]|uniref:Uncharacterized protein n=6 Tax=Viruses TaxID=10239 RepID=J3U9T4_9CAUD|nr:hypothetical protein D865_gp052 [Caulobacter phage phiCbK]YP_006989433.1 hypothetical protein CcrKarma_gp053 [Caulobacter virus Karma]YP_006989783.1 hypothetical protein D870_gp050 [Caulobacter phage CcrSwift]ARB13580.1 hypothetical protein Ccr10_gp052 [Caulobacter phage Ccr10]ARB13926.1 hypothetical protein Ccr2_gp051 [Caulobacter phage Ccr2]ARB14269.1 hypothetical protein Ccr5_gp051 [Caulobacter phage Ccr5]ARB14615.1 hypothetical protein Ccr29_gp058 [Caulobacter phage Ccr29]ARB14971.1 h
MKLTVSGQDMSGTETVYLMLVPRVGVRLESDKPVTLTFDPLPGAAGAVRVDPKTPLTLAENPKPSELRLLPAGAEQVFYLNANGRWMVTFREEP